MEQQIDYRKIHDQDINLVTCTPVIGGRKLQRDKVPESPLLQQYTNKFEATPLMNGIKLKENGDSN